MSAQGFEQVVAARGGRSGVAMVIAVHSTVLGPALGGARLWHYPDEEAARADAMRLAEAMTLKAAAAGLDLGGGKGVIAAPGPAAPEGHERRRILLDFGDLVDSLGGRYITAEDVGTSAADMEVIATRTDYVVGRRAERGGSGDPSPVTARGVLAAMRACAAMRWHSRSLAGREVCVIGLGNVGSRLAKLLAADGARLIVTDIDPARRSLAERLGARWIDPGDAERTRCEILAPCALGGLIGSETVRLLRCEIVCGAANNVLSDPAVALRLERAGILYAPDFIANAGGLISVYGELHGFDHAGMVSLAEGIEETMGEILAEAERAGESPLHAARRRAQARLLDAPAAVVGG